MNEHRNFDMQDLTYITTSIIILLMLSAVIIGLNNQMRIKYERRNNADTLRVPVSLGIDGCAPITEWGIAVRKVNINGSYSIKEVILRDPWTGDVNMTLPETNNRFESAKLFIADTNSLILTRCP